MNNLGFSYEDIIYITRSNRSTDVYLKNKTINVSLTIEKLIDELLNESLTTYSGRLISTIKNYHIRKHVPIYINKDIILQPINNKDSWNETLVSFKHIIDYAEEGRGTRLYFDNGGSLLVEFSTKKMYNILRNCEIILNKQFNIERKKIYG